MYRLKQRIRYFFEGIGVTLVLGLLRLLPLDVTSDIGGFSARKFGPRFKVSDVGRQNLTAAFPEKTPAEIEKILAGVWDNLGRTGAEYAQLDRIWDIPPSGPVPGGRIEVASLEQFMELRDSRKACIFYTAHCANWELLPISAANHGLPLAIVYRRPNNPTAARLVEKIRRRSMGRLLPSGVLGTLAAAEALQRGESLGMLVDQYFGRGLDLPFFGRPARTATTLAGLALRFGCPVVGTFVERLDGARFRIHLLPPIEVTRTGNDAADAEALMTKVTKSVEDWIRARPEQWLWLHRRWR